ncbi:putative SOS response-associated peptidase YedK [Rhizobium giardinii]|uniref:Putative SOS response-associated peptidase YedK n=1 Tax=Rhizobium giardinii TaxID=56731 RepID=A0A7W8X835_9HYPH|nr:putative SOS response-associated peptidase YedK [Rhizobium giardinii]
MSRPGHQLRGPDPASQEEGGKVPNAWFARDEERSLMFFAGMVEQGSLL